MHGPFVVDAAAQAFEATLDAAFEAGMAEAH